MMHNVLSLSLLIGTTLGDGDCQNTDALLRALKSTDTTVRIEAAKKLNALGEGCRPFLPAIVESYSQEADMSVYLELRQALIKNKGASVKAIEHFISDQAREPGKRILLLGFLDAFFRLYEPEYMPTIVACLNDKDNGVSFTCAAMVCKWNPSNEAAIKRIIKIMEDGYIGIPQELRTVYDSAAASALIRTHEKGRAIPILMRDLKTRVRNKPGELSEFEIVAIGYGLDLLARADKIEAVQHHQLRQEHAKYLSSKDAETVGVFFSALLLKFDPKDAKARQHLMDLPSVVDDQLSGDFSYLFIAAAEALGKDAYRHRGRLNLLAKSSDVEIRAAARSALKKIGK